MLAGFDMILIRLLRWGSMACLIMLLLIMTATVFVRFVPLTSMGWSDEIVEFAFAWMVFLGAAALWRDGLHFRVELVPHRLAGMRIGRALEIVLSLMSLSFLAVFTYEGWLLSLGAWDRSPILELPRWLWYSVIPISGSIMMGYTLRSLWKIFITKGKTNIEGKTLKLQQ